MDDDEKISEVLGRMLGQLGYEMDFANDGSQAIEKFVKAKESGWIFDVVILDLPFPAAWEVKRHRDTFEIDPN